MFMIKITIKTAKLLLCMQELECLHTAKKKIIVYYYNNWLLRTVIKQGSKNRNRVQSKVPYVCNLSCA